MATAVRTLDLSTDVVALTAALIDVPSQSHQEAQLADLVQAALAGCAHLSVQRFGNTIVAQTQLGHSERVLIGGHLDTVPSADNIPHHFAGDQLYGLGSCDMKGGVAIALRLAATIPSSSRDVTYIFYECEEVAGKFNGLQKLADEQPHLLEADLAILLEPSNAAVEAGCQGTLRAEISVNGVRAHSARSWLGENAIHSAVDVLQILGSYVPRRPIVDGLEYREGLNAVAISAGVAGNVIPDSCMVTVNYRFAPDRSTAEAKAHVEEVFAGYDVVVVDLAAGARPGLDRPAAAEFVAAVGLAPAPKFGWTDVARFSAMGTPALNFGPGDPSLAHSADEHVSIEQLRACEAHLRTWLA